MWKNSSVVWVDGFSSYHIDAIINGGTEDAWRLIGFYGEPDTNIRSEGWNMLWMLSSKPKLPWVCFGDINELLQVEDKKRGAPRAHNLMQAFVDVLDHCGFVDLGYSGLDFTWHGRRRGELIWERLDRGVANYEWLARFPTRRIRHLHCFTSDHRPILLSLDSNGEQQRWRCKPFRFEAMWLTSPDCNGVVSRAWAINYDGTPMHVVSKKLKTCKKMLTAWNLDHFGSVLKKTKKNLRSNCGRQKWIPSNQGMLRR